MKPRRTQLFAESSAHLTTPKPNTRYWYKQKAASCSTEAQDEARRAYWQFVADDMRQAVWIRLT